MNSRNTVATILQCYAWLNAFAGLVVAGMMLNSNIEGIIAFFVFCLVLMASFVIYAFGEAIQLLHDIKENTSRKADQAITELEDIEAHLPMI